MSVGWSPRFARRAARSCRVRRRRWKIGCWNRWGSDVFDVFDVSNWGRWVWINTYRYIFSGMNIHLPAILMFTRGIGFWPIPISAELVIFLIFGFRKWWSNGEMQIHPVTGEKNNHESPVIAGGYMIFQWQWMRDDEYNGALSVMDLLEIKDWCIEHSDKF